MYCLLALTKYQILSLPKTFARCMTSHNKIWEQRLSPAIMLNPYEENDFFTTLDHLVRG